MRNYIWLILIHRDIWQRSFVDFLPGLALAGGSYYQRGYRGVPKRRVFQIAGYSQQQRFPNHSVFPVGVSNARVFPLAAKVFPVAGFS